MIQSADSTTRKTVVHVWIPTAKNVTQKVGETTSYWGLGDMVRGSAAVYSVCEELGIRCVVVTRHHPVSNYLVIHDTDVDDTVRANVDDIRWEVFYGGNLPALRAFITSNVQRQDVLMFGTNATLDIYETNLSEECKAYMRQLLTFRPVFTNAWRERALLQNLQLPDTGPEWVRGSHKVTHVRLRDAGDGPEHSCSLCRPEGDESRVDVDAGQCPACRALLCMCVHAEDERGELLLSNSSAFKDFARRMLDNKILTIDTLPVHVGMSTVLSHWQSMEDTMFELFLMCSSARILTFNAYDWISNFAAIAHHVYDVPLVDMKMQGPKMAAGMSLRHVAEVTCTRLERLRNSNSTHSRALWQSVLRRLTAFDWKYYVRHNTAAADRICDMLLSCTRDVCVVTRDDFAIAALLHYVYVDMFTTRDAASCAAANCARLLSAYTRSARTQPMLRRHFDPVFYSMAYLGNGDAAGASHATKRVRAYEHYRTCGRRNGYFRNVTDMLEYMRRQVTTSAQCS